MSEPDSPRETGVEEAEIQQNLGEFPDRFADQGEVQPTPAAHAAPRKRAASPAAPPPAATPPAATPPAATPANKPSAKAKTPAKAPAKAAAKPADAASRRRKT
jgi:hypothetical protein